MAGEREFNIDALLIKLQQRQEKRNHRPIKVYRTAYDEEKYRLLHDNTLADTPEGKRVREEQRAYLEELKRIQAEPPRNFKMTSYENWRRQYVEWDHQVKEKHINALRSIQGLSRRINIASTIFKPEYLEELKEQDKETLDPILTGLAKRSVRLAKAQRAMQRIRKRRGEDQPHE